MSQRSEPSAIPSILPLIPLRDLSLFPNLVVPLFVGRERSIKALEEAMREGHLVALATQRKAETQDPRAEDIYEIGCVATVMQELKLPDGTAKALVEGKQRFRVLEYLQTEPFFLVRVELIDEIEEVDVETEALMRAPWWATSSTRQSSADRFRMRCWLRLRRLRSPADWPTLWPSI